MTPSRPSALFAAVLAAALLTACSSWPLDEPLTPADTGEQAGPVSADAFDHGSWSSLLLRWQRDRDEALASPDGYLALAGLWWLGEGEHVFGTSPDAALVLPDGPARAGVLIVDADGVRLDPAPDATVFVDGQRLDAPTPLLADDAPDGPSEVGVGRLTFWLIRRGDLLGVRLRDPRSPVLLGYTGTERWEGDPAWRVPARLVPFDEPTTVSVPNVLGQVSEQASPGRLVFELDGVTHTLTPTGEPGDDLFVIFTDATSGEESYGGGRFLVVRAPDVDGHTAIDFNRAYNPPCAYSPYTTCPLPPEGNELPIAVRVGERAYDGEAHP